MDRKMYLTGKTMKTSRIIFMLALAAAATACNKAELEGTDPAGLKSNQFLASIEGASTKVTMSEDDFSLSWVAGDQVSVFESEAMKNELFTATEDGYQTTLDGGGVTVDQEKTYYAVYPYSEKNSLADGIITTEIPTVQTPKQGDIPVNIAVAKNDGQTFTFYNVCGLVGFNITTDNIKSVTVKSNDSSDYLTGLISVRQEEVGNPTYAVAGGQSYVTLEAEATFSTGYHYVAVLPQTFEKGITVVMTDSYGKVAQKTTTNPFTLNRSHRIDIKNIDESQTWGEKLTSIRTAAELQRFLAVADKYAEGETVTLADDIDVKDCNLVPAASFAGIFDGADNSITNWNTSTALFEKLTGTVQNLVIGESCNLVVQANGDAAFIALENAGTISNCINPGTVTSVEESFVPDVKAQYNDRAIGTIAAVSTGSIVSCVNNGTVTITPASVGKYALQFIGGIAGKASASADDNAMDSCTNNGAVTFDGPFSSKLFIGGVCGGTPAGAGTFGDYGVFKTLKNTAPVTLQVPTPSSVASTYINLGGVIGYAEADLDDCDNSGVVTVDLPNKPSSAGHAYQRPAIAGVVGTCLYNVANCNNSGNMEVKGAFGDGDEKTVGAGYYYRAYFGGVVAFAGSATAESVNTEYKLESCKNSGKLSFDLEMHNSEDAFAHIGGIAGNAVSNVSDCTNEGAGVFVKNCLSSGYVGGIVGLLGLPENQVKGSVALCTNKAIINYDAVIAEADENKSRDIYVGGIAGNMQYSYAKLLTSHNEGNIKVVGGPASGNCYVGGLTGFIGKMQIAGTNSDSGRLKSKGNIVVDTRKKVSVGGIVGRASHQILDVAVANDSIKVLNPGTGSMIGGVCGDRQINTSGDARMKEVTTNIHVTNDDNNTVYLGCWYGSRSDTATAFHSTSFVGSVTYPSSVTFGFIAGILNTGAVIQVGSSGKVIIPKTTVVNGTEIGELDETALKNRLFGVNNGTVTYKAGNLVQE